MRSELEDVRHTGLRDVFGLGAGAEDDAYGSVVGDALEVEVARVGGLWEFQVKLHQEGRRRSCEDEVNACKGVG